MVVSSLSYNKIFRSIDTIAKQFYHLVNTEPTSLYNLEKNFKINGFVYGNVGFNNVPGNYVK